MSPKVALFLPSLGGGGAERVFVNLAHGFLAHGIKVDFVLLKAEGPYLSELHPDVRVVDFRLQQPLSGLIPLIRYLRRERPDALLSGLNYSNLLAVWAGRLSGTSTRIVVSQHEFLSKAVMNAPSLRRRLMPLLVRWFFPWADIVVAVSQGVSADLTKFFGTRGASIRVIHNPIVTPELLQKAGEPVTLPWASVSSPPLILGVGRLAPQKDFPTLIRAFANVCRKMPARLMILGEGEDRPQLEALVLELGLEKEIVLQGFVANPYAYMARSAVFVLSSAWEGFGNVLVEAMAVGTPVVSTDCPSGPAEILGQVKGGRLVAVGDVDGMTEAIISMLETKPDGKALIDRAADFTLDRATIKYLQILGIK